MSIRSEIKEMLRQCAWNAVFHHGNDAAESKMAREMRCFTVERGVGWREGRCCKTAGAMFAYVRLWSGVFEIVRSNGGP